MCLIKSLIYQIMKITSQNWAAISILQDNCFLEPTTRSILISDIKIPELSVLTRSHLPILRLIQPHWSIHGQAYFLGSHVLSRQVCISSLASTSTYQWSKTVIHETHSPLLVEASRECWSRSRPCILWSDQTCQLISKRDPVRQDHGRKDNRISW